LNKLLKNDFRSPFSVIPAPALILLGQAPAGIQAF
jgi:hypothetical protein